MIGILYINGGHPIKTLILSHYVKQPNNVPKFARRGFVLKERSKKKNCSYECLNRLIFVTVLYIRIIYLSNNFIEN